MKDLLLESTIIQGIVTLILVCVVCYLCVVGLPVPDILTQSLFAIIGFWFGSKAGQASRRYVIERNVNDE